MLSQVILSFGIPFALIPLVVFTSRRDIMGVLRNHRATTVAAIGVATVIVSAERVPDPADVRSGLEG